LPLLLVEATAMAGEDVDHPGDAPPFTPCPEPAISPG
jgi:hypothetical protein